MISSTYLKRVIEKYKNYAIIVEGKKDVLALKSAGFSKVYPLHQNSLSIRESIEKIVSQIDKKETVTILTDLDKKGEQLQKTIQPILQELGITIDSSFRKLLIKANISHIEGIFNFLDKIEDL